jgi:PAS domain S-box-containing protein
MGEGLYTVNCEGLLTTMNPAAEMLFGWRRDELLGRKMHDITHYKHRDGTAFPAEACAGLQVLRRGTLLKDHADVFIRKDGTFFDVVYSSSPIRERGQIVGVVVVFRDVTESNNLITSLSESEARFRQLTAELELRVAERTQELTESQERLRALTADLNLTEHRERSRLATELHDHLAQILSYGLLTLQRARGMAVVIPQCAGLLKDTEDALTKSLTYTRTLIVELSPPMLRERGLGAAVRWLGEQMKKYDLLVSIEAPESAALTMAEDRAALLLQSVRELLINIAKHAQTDQATVNLQCQDGMLRVEVRDKGCGFDLLYAATSAPTITSTKFGLFSIHERMKAVGGSLRMVSVKGNGTTATLTLPLDTPAESKA